MSARRTLARLRAGAALLRPREFRWIPYRCPLCGPSILVQLCRDEIGVRCLRCSASAVHLALATVLRDLGTNLSASDVCELSARGPLVEYLRRSARSLALSEYFPDIAPGEYRSGVRCEDVQRLTYADASFDLVTHTEVLEHVTDDARAYAELRRVLRPRGTMVFTVPMQDADETVERVRLGDQGVEYPHPAAYHGDPLRGGAGVLVWRDYGRDILFRLKRAGFARVESRVANLGVAWVAPRTVIVAHVTDR